MKRKLFALEFRRTALPVVALTFAAVAVLYVVQVASRREGRSDADVRLAIDAIVLLLAAVSGLFIGVPTFCGESRRREIAFLEAQPLERAWLWAILVSSRIAAASLGFTIVVALRPWLLGGGQPSLLFFGAVECHFVLLAAGCCFGAAFRKPPFAFAATLLTTAFAIFETVVGIPTSIPDVTVAASRVGVISAAFFGLSAWFVQRSELDLFRSRVRNLSALAAASAALVFAMQQPPPRYIDDNEGVIGRPGCVFAIAKPHHSTKTRVALFDTHTGNRLGSVTVPNVRRALFSEDGERLWLESSIGWPLRILDLALPRGRRVVAVRRDGGLVGPYPLEAADIAAFQPIERGRALMVSGGDSQGTVVELDATGRGARERLVAPLDYGASIGRAGERWLVTFFNHQPPPSRTWMVNGEVNELKSTPGEYEWPRPPLIEGTLYPSQRAAAAALGERLGTPAGEILVPGFRDAERGWILRTVGGDAQRLERIDVLAPGATRWSPLDSESAGPGATYAVLDADLNAGVLVFARRSAARSGTFVRDLATGRGLEVEALSERPAGFDAELHAASAGDRYVVTIDRFQRGADSPKRLGRSIVVGNRASGSLATLPTVSQPFGYDSKYWTDVEGNTVFYDGEKRVYRLHLAAGGVLDLVP